MLHTLTVQVRTESNDMSVFCSICFHTLKNSLCILKDTCTLTDGNHIICGKASLIPLAVFIIGYITVVCFYITKAQVAPVNVLFFHNNFLLAWFLGGDSYCESPMFLLL